MWPFRRKPLLEADTARWHLENAAWWMRNHGERVGPPGKRLVLPAKEHFQSEGLAGHALALALFEQAKAHCGLEKTPVTLVRSGTGIAGSVTPQIAYPPDAIVRPQSFIAAIAHALARYVLASGASEPPPIRDGEEGLLADLAAVHLGFGVFLANSAFSTQDHEDGWSYARQGYLPERELVFSLAVFLRAREISPAKAADYLKADLAVMLKQALRDLDGHRDDIARLRGDNNVSK